jgi:hypothetical protein
LSFFIFGLLLLLWRAFEVPAILTKPQALSLLVVSTAQALNTICHIPTGSRDFLPHIRFPICPTTLGNGSLRQPVARSGEMRHSGVSQAGRFIQLAK